MFNFARPIQSVGASLDAVLAEILAEAFADFSFVSVPRKHGLALTVRLHLRAIHALRAAKQQVIFSRDVSHTLAPQSACPAPLSDADYTLAAARHGITMAAIKAVAQIESGGRSGFDDQYRAKILFEAHHFRKHTKRLYDLTHPHLSCA